MATIMVDFVIECEHETTLNLELSAPAAITTPSNMSISPHGNQSAASKPMAPPAAASAKRLLAANRNEIAIRVFRAATELGLRTVAIYAQEDRLSIHRFKADEAYLIGEDKGPVSAYLDIPGIIALAKEKQIDLIHPGYGFLAENAEFARACAAAGITFVGPRPEILDLMGNKVAARELARKNNIPTLAGTEEPVQDR